MARIPSSAELAIDLGGEEERKREIGRNPNGDLRLCFALLCFAFVKYKTVGEDWRRGLEARSGAVYIAKLERNHALLLVNTA